MHMTADTDRVEKKILLRASRSRVWRALTDAEQFGSWFGLALDGPFAAGRTITGKRRQSSVEPDFKSQSERELEIAVESIEPERRFSFRWHPYAVDDQYDYSAEPMTLVVFTLEDAAEGIQLTVVESGFNAIGQRGREAFGAHLEGWPIVLGWVDRYVARG
jgi:uncharacterized protein YndB with AHSA1/START domain